MKLSSITRKRKRSCFVIQSGSTHTFGTYGFFETSNSRLPCEREILVHAKEKFHNTIRFSDTVDSLQYLDENAVMPIPQLILVRQTLHGGIRRKTKRKQRLRDMCR